MYRNKLGQWRKANSFEHAMEWLPIALFALPAIVALMF